MKKNLINLARKLRKNQTKAEKLLWGRLRAEQVEGFKFRRQHPEGKYILDFVCLGKMLVVEVDGSQHGTEKGIKKDDTREKWLEGRGYRILRFSNSEVMKNMYSVVETVRRACLER